MENFTRWFHGTQGIAGPSTKPGGQRIVAGGSQGGVNPKPVTAPGPSVADVIGSTPPPPSSVPNIADATAAGMQQRRRARKYATLIEGQPADNVGINPAPVYKRPSLLGY